MNKKDLIRLIEPFPDDAEIALLNDEFCEYFVPKTIRFIELGTFKDLDYKETSDWPEMSIRDIDCRLKEQKLISSKKYIYID
jgi:hypothetical protein